VLDALGRVTLSDSTLPDVFNGDREIEMRENKRETAIEREEYSRYSRAAV